MSLSDKIEQERQEMLARREQGRQAQQERGALEAEMMSNFNARLRTVLTGLSPETVRWESADDARTTTLVIGDFRENAPTGGRRRERAAGMRLQASCSAEGRTWSLSAEYQRIRYDVEKPEDSERLRNPRLSTSSLDEAMEWMELRLVRGIAAVQVWQAEHPVTVPSEAVAAPAVAAPADDGETGRAPDISSESNGGLPWWGWLLLFVSVMTLKAIFS
jgi:hypothetical protein